MSARAARCRPSTTVAAGCTAGRGTAESEAWALLISIHPSPSVPRRRFDDDFDVQAAPRFVGVVAGTSSTCILRRLAMHPPGPPNSCNEFPARDTSQCRESRTSGRSFCFRPQFRPQAGTRNCGQNGYGSSVRGVLAPQRTTHSVVSGAAVTWPVQMAATADAVPCSTRIR